MDTSAKKRRRRTHEERREEAERRLLEAAVRIIGKTGVETFTLADVGEAAGYSRGLPAHYFETKSGLLAAVVRYLVDHYFHRATFQGRQRITTDDIVAEISSFIEVAKKSPLAAKAFMAAMAGTLTNPSLADIAQKHNAYVISKYEEGILNGIKHREMAGLLFIDHIGTHRFDTPDMSRERIECHRRANPHIPSIFTLQCIIIAPPNTSRRQQPHMTLVDCHKALHSAIT